jgi:uncharacterized protein YbcI
LLALLEARNTSGARPADFSNANGKSRIQRDDLQRRSQSVPSQERVERPIEGNDAQISKLAEISREMVRLYKVQFGRGPTRARSDFAGPDLIVCTLEDSLTPAEKRMAEMGDHQRLRDLRLYFQHATEDQFREIIERILGRKVRAFISGMDTSNDVAAELFYLEG